MKRPAFQFYPADWRKDSALQACSVGARGLWIELMCIMHECEPYGHLAVNGRPVDVAGLARLVGESPATVKKLLQELENAAVFSRREDGCIFSRRMVKDERLRDVRAQAGRLGGNPNLLNQKDKQKDNHDANQSGKQSPTPSSSSSSSEFSKPDGLENKRYRAATFPPDVPEQVQRDFLALRKSKKAPLTQTALDGIAAEATKAGISLTAALETCCARGWQGFKAEWVRDQQASQTGASGYESARDKSRREFIDGIFGKRGDEPTDITGTATRVD